MLVAMSSDDDEKTGPSAFARIGAAMGRMRIMTGRRYIGRLAISRVGAGLELSHLDVLSLVRRLGLEQEVTVGAVAEQLRIDHSRASRIVTDLVKRGVVRRAASQEDGRRTIVTLTEDGMQLLARVNGVKEEVLAKVLDDWSPEDMAAFATLYTRFIEGLEAQARDFDAGNAGK